MQKIYHLTQKLSSHLSFSKSRLECLVNILQALFICESVNLVKIANRFKGNAKTSSKYKHLQRFFSQNYI